MPAGLHRSFIEIAMANALTKYGATTMLGPRLSPKIDLNTYVVAGIDDHISPWPSAYRAAQMLGGERGSCYPTAATSKIWSTRRQTRRPPSG